MDARNTLPAVGTTVYAIVKNKSSFKLEVVEGTLEAINEENFKVARNHTDCITDVYIYPMYAWRQECFLTKEEADVGLALLRDQQSGEGSHHKPADKFAREMPTRPGKVLAAKLKEQNLSPLDMQKALGMDDNEFYKLDCGLIPVTQEMAEKLGEIISGTNAEFWMAAEAKYRMEREALIEDLVKSCLDA